MKRMMMLALVALTTIAHSFADDFTTAGNGTAWTMTKLSETDGSGVTKEGNVFTLANTVVIAPGDRFVLEDGITVMLAKAVNFEIEGTAKMVAQSEQRVLFTRSAEDVVPGVVYLKCEDTETVPVSYIDFEYVGLKYFGGVGLTVSNCTFRYHEASTANGTSALNLAGEGAQFTVHDCIFEKNKRAAIGGAANSSNPTTIYNCEFLYNDQQNLNYPQLNLTASSLIHVHHNRVIGDRTKTRGGGIMVADLLGVATNPTTIIENNEVRDNRYGIALYAGQKAMVRYNTIVDNNTETNPNNGGSGINVYDTSGTQETMITGNRIEGSLWGISIIGGKSVNCGRVDVAETDDGYNPGHNVFYNNGNNGEVYDLYNNSANTVYAQNNYWKTAATQDAESIENVITHKNDNAALGEVIFTPFLTEEPTGITRITTPATADAVFSLGGIRHKELQKGLNIVIRNGKAIKIMK